MENSYVKGSTYEEFMGRAFNDYTRMKSGTHGSTFSNLIDSENGLSNVKHLGSTQKLMDNVQKYMHKAMDKYLANKKLSTSAMAELKGLKSEIDRAGGSHQLHQIMKRTLALTENLYG